MSATYEHEFTWSGEGQNVIATGTFDDWKSSLPLTRNAEGKLSAKAQVPYGQKIAYKYVVDSAWQHNPNEAHETDESGNVNNVFTAPEKAPEAVASTLLHPAAPVVAEPVNVVTEEEATSVPIVPETVPEVAAIAETPAAVEPVAEAPAAVAPAETVVAPAPAPEAAVVPEPLAIPTSTLADVPAETTLAAPLVKEDPAEPTHTPATLLETSSASIPTVPSDAAIVAGAVEPSAAPLSNGHKDVDADATAAAVVEEAPVAAPAQVASVVEPSPIVNGHKDAEADATAAPEASDAPVAAPAQEVSPAPVFPTVEDAPTPSAPVDTLASLPTETVASSLAASPATPAPQLRKKKTSFFGKIREAFASPKK